MIVTQSSPSDFVRSKEPKERDMWGRREENSVVQIQLGGGLRRVRIQAAPTFYINVRRCWQGFVDLLEEEKRERSIEDAR